VGFRRGAVELREPPERALKVRGIEPVEEKCRFSSLHRGDRRVLAIGRGIFELTGFPEADLMGRDVVEALALSDDKPVELASEWGVRRLGEQLSIRTRGGHEKKVVADVFPAYDDDGGLLVALTPIRG